MPIISKIGARSAKVRLIHALIYGVLILGSASMVYPFLLLLSGSVKSEADFFWVRPYPEYLFDDDILYMKYVESKYETISIAEAARWEPIGSWRAIHPPHHTNPQVLQEFDAFRQSFPMPASWYRLGQVSPVGKNRRLFVAALQEKFHSDIEAYATASGTGVQTWSGVEAPRENDMYSIRYHPGMSIAIQEYYSFKRSRPPEDRVLVNLDGCYWKTFLIPRYGPDIAQYNQQHGTAYVDYRQVYLTDRALRPGLERDDWEEFVRDELNRSFIRLSPAAGEAFQRFLAGQPKYGGDIAALNRSYRTRYVSFEQVEMPQSAPEHQAAYEDWSSFIKDRHGCPLDAIEVYGPRQAFEDFVARRRGVDVQTIRPLALPVEEADYQDLKRSAGAYRWEFFTRNYRLVLDYVLLHGNGIRNTIVFCLLMIGTQLLVNPLAAYALSRYRPRGTYHILLFCMATMAFPAEVTMIPSFLLLKRFPLWPLLIGGGVALAGALIFPRVLRKGRRVAAAWAAPAVGAVAGCWVVPQAMGWMGWSPTQSLLNTFTALVWPAMANGFFIFLLKGFFDSLPRELYESAEIDGAGEFTKFWAITMSLSKPILAVIALGAFTAAYSAFLQAMIIVPEQRMWTIMVWLYQLQDLYKDFQPVVYASLVVAAIPTLLVFIFCQNLIIRGIVVPVEK